MPLFRKKPVVIEAVQWLAPFPEVPDWLSHAIGIGPKTGGVMRMGDTIRVFTLEGEMAAEIGDWIIKGVKGELYPCKPDIFAATYEREPDRRPIDALNAMFFANPGLSESGGRPSA